MPCEIQSNLINNQRDIDRNRYLQLHPEGRELISGWFQRALLAINCSPESAFEPFIFTWFAFNGWAACVTDNDNDRSIINSLASSQIINNDFEQAIMNNQYLNGRASVFFSMLPIFDVRTLRRRGILQPAGNNRREIVTYYLNRRVSRFEPQCWEQHLNTNESPPAAWGHIINGIYKVRCNLFHGLKSTHSEMDQTIVHSAFLVLAHFLNETGYLNIT